MNRSKFSSPPDLRLKSRLNFFLIFTINFLFYFSLNAQTCPPASPGNMITEGGFEICPVPINTTQDFAINTSCAPPWEANNGNPSINNHRLLAKVLILLDEQV